MYIKILDRARSYLSGGQRSLVIHSTTPIEIKSPMLRQIDAASDAKINAMNNVELLRLLERVLGESLNKTLGGADAART